MRIEFSKNIGKDVKRLKDRRFKARLEKVVLELQAIESLYEFHGDLSALSGVSDYYRIRIGDYRLVFKALDNGIELLHFRHRKDVYKEFP